MEFHHKNQLRRGVGTEPACWYLPDVPQDLGFGWCLPAAGSRQARMPKAWEERLMRCTKPKAVGK